LKSSAVLKEPATVPNKANNAHERTALITKEHTETGEVKRDVYFVYMRALGLSVCLIIFLCNLFGAAASVGSSFWLSYWSSQTPGNSGNPSLGVNLGVYGVLGVGNAVGVLMSTLAMALGSIHASGALHKKMLLSVLRSPMSFFDTTPLGRVINRFAKDVYTIDETVPASLRSFLSMTFNVRCEACILF
jgi:ATP-binding cassette subfamily C (CFTR/MRP) protein 1